MQAEGWQAKGASLLRLLGTVTFYWCGSVLKKGNGIKAHFPLMCRLCLKPILNG